MSANSRKDRLEIRSQENIEIVLAGSYIQRQTAAERKIQKKTRKQTDRPPNSC